MMKYFFFAWMAVAGMQSTAYAQDSSHLRISLLTCTPGDELYSIFGHSAIRIIDSARGSDIVYNYGTFDFDDASFYLKFIRGKLLYYVSAEYFRDFEYTYRSTGRSITDQPLNFSPTEKAAFQQALNTNLLEENKYYKYDFFFDNCTTRLRDFLLRFNTPPPLLPAVMDTHTTFRNAIHQYLNKGKQYWSKLGIDILLGARTDRVMSPAEQQFLPDNLMLASDQAIPPIVVKKQSYPAFKIPEKETVIFTPLICFSIVATGFFLLAFFKSERTRSVVNGLDGLLFFSVGFLGLILVFMWIGTDHSMTKNNYNLCWAWPTHTVAAFLLNSKKKWVKKYFLFNAILQVLLLVIWYFLPQQMNYALIPVVFLLIYRSTQQYLAVR